MSMNAKRETVNKEVSMMCDSDSIVYVYGVPMYPPEVRVVDSIIMGGDVLQNPRGIKEFLVAYPDSSRREIKKSNIDGK